MRIPQQPVAPARGRAAFGPLRGPKPGHAVATAEHRSAWHRRDECMDDLRALRLARDARLALPRNAYHSIS